MRKIISKISGFLLGIGLVASAVTFVGSKKAESVSATTETITFLTTNSQITATGTDKTITDSTSGVVLTFSNVTAISATNVQNAKSATIISTEIPGTISSVKVYDCATTSTKTDGSFTVYGGTSSSSITTKVEEVSGLSSTASDHEVDFTGNSFTYFKIENGSARVLKHSKIEVVYSAQDPSLDTLTIKANGTEADSATMNYSIGTTLFYAYDESDNEVTGCNWSISDDSIASIALNGNNVAYVTFIKYGTVVITAEKSGYNNGTFELTINPGTLTSVVVTGSMTKTSYYVGESWSPAGLVATASYSYGYSYDASNDVIWSYNPSSPSVGVTSVVATATLSSISGSSSSQAVTVSRTNPIQVIYTQSSGSVDVYGYYVGFLDGTGPVIMDGAYGIVVYNKTADVSGYTAGETILHVTGSISIYNGLYEVASASISVASGSFDEPETPITYAAKGGETADYASRLTTVTGTPTVTKGSFDSDAGTADITMNFAVGLHTIQVFYKKAAQTSDAEAFAAVKAAVENSTEITVKGFTGWYNGFQIQMNGYIPAAVGYTAEDFSQDLLDQTDEVCSLYEDGVTPYNDQKNALILIWNNLSSNDKYPSLPSDQKTILAEADRDEEGTVVEQAMARYDYLTGKYDLSNFINGRTPVVFAESNHFVPGQANTTSSTIVIVVVALTSITSIGVLLVIKRKRSLVK